jgi:hypothetical protein
MLMSYLNEYNKIILVNYNLSYIFKISYNFL